MKIAIIGTGNISGAHISGLLEFPGQAEIAALCDIYPEKAAAKAREYHLEVPIFKDYQEMLRELPEIELVHVCTPPYTHAQISIDAMDAGKHVIVEKPMAGCLSECDAMLKAEQRNGVVLSVIAQNRFRNSIDKLKKVVDAGIAGPIRCAHIHSHWWRGHCYYDLWWRGLWEKEGGGPTLNHAVHHIDMLNWLTGTLPEEAVAVLSNVMHDNSEVEDISLAALKYAGGSVANVVSSVIHHGEEQGIELQCAHAKIAAPWDLKAEISTANGFPAAGGNKELLIRLQAFYDSLPALPHEGHPGQFADVLTAIANGKRPLVTGEDGRRTVELITAIYQAGCEKRYVRLPITPDNPWYTFEGILAHATRFYRKSGCVENFEQGEISLGNY